MGTHTGNATGDRSSYTRLTRRRFFHRKYNAGQAPAELAAMARNDSDLDVLSAHVVFIVKQAMHLAQVYLCLKEVG